MSSIFAHETQSSYKKALEVVARIDHMIGQPAPVSGLQAQVNQAAADLIVRIAEALGSIGSSDRARRLEHSNQMATALAALLDVLQIRGGDAHAIQAIKMELLVLSNMLSTAAKSVTANKQLRERVRM